MSNRRKARNAPQRTTLPDAPPQVHAGAPLGVLVDALARAGWGPFAGRYWAATRAILHALGRLLGASGQGLTTAPQIADAAGYSEVWVRRKLHELEEAGLLTWDRGGIVDGAPTASFIRVSKVQLADTVSRAREEAGPKVLERARATARRIAEAGLRFTKSLRQKRRGPSITGEEPSPLKREDGWREPARPVTGTLLNGPRPVVGSRFAAVRALQQQRAAEQLVGAAA